ncbi:MAG TPA: PAS domain S-box protein [Bacteroidetes bacterium]|nr:PAS domain S-box protein [Bacteroidota bacterium]
MERFRRNRIEILQSIKEGRQTWKDLLNEVDIQRPDGARRSIQSSVFRVMTDDSFLIVSVIRDITDQKRAEENLKSSEERFAKFTAAVTDVIYRYDPINNRYDFISPSFERQTGYTLEELHADPVGVTKNLTHPDDVDQIFNAVDEHIRKGSEAGPIAVQYRVVRKDGRIIWVSDRKDFEFGDDGWVCRINGIVRDITERVQTQERLDSLIRSLPDTILYQTGGGTEYVSSNVENVIGYSVQEISSNRKFFPRLIHPDDRKLLKETHQGWLKSGADGVVEVEFRVKRRDGEYIWMLDRMITAYLTPEGRHSYFGVMIDITRRKQSEEEREKLISELQEALSKIKVLSGLVPICAHCKKIRDDKGYWNQLEDYIAQHSDMVFSHGTCPECARKLYPDYYNEDDDH